MPARAKTLAGMDRDTIEQHPNIRLLRYLADIYLVSGRWQVRNMGVKLAGLTQYGQRRELLLTLASSRTTEVGFIRRNALTSLARIGEWDNRLERLLTEALSQDPYYEVRVESARTIIRLKQFARGNKNLSEHLLRNMDHNSLEVRWSCIEALGVTGSADQLPIFPLGLALHCPTGGSVRRCSRPWSIC